MKEKNSHSAVASRYDNKKINLKKNFYFYIYFKHKKNRLGKIV